MIGALVPTLLAVTAVWAQNQGWRETTNTNLGRGQHWVVVKRNLDDFTDRSDEIIAHFDSEEAAKEHARRLNKEEKQWWKWLYTARKVKDRELGPLPYDPLDGRRSRPTKPRPPAGPRTRDTGIGRQPHGSEASDDGSEASDDGFWAPPFADVNDSAEPSDEVGTGVTKENGVISVRRRPPRSRPEAPETYVVWEKTANGKEVIRRVTNNFREAQLAKQEIERTGGRAYQRDFGSSDAASAFVAREFKAVTWPEKTWVDQPGGAAASISGNVTERNGVVSVGRRSDRDAPEAYVVWEETADGKKVLRRLTKSAKEAQLAKQEIERTGGRAYRKEFDSYNDATVYIAREFKEIVMPEQKWVDVKPIRPDKITMPKTKPVDTKPIFSRPKEKPTPARRKDLAGTAWGRNRVMIRFKSGGVLEHIDTANDRNPFLRGTWRSTGPASFSGKAYRPPDAGGFDLTIEVTGEVVGEKLRGHAKMRMKGYGGPHESGYDYTYDRQ
jgi:hypothetical protein